jgi:crossover junction endodeoxyribonuclease RusA
MTAPPVRTWTMLILAPGPWLTANQRHGWAARNRVTQAWRHTAGWVARIEGLPTGLDHVRIVVKPHFRDRRSRDIGNWSPTAKAIVDGLVDHGVVADDDDTHVTGPDMRPGEVRDVDCVTVMITALDGPITGARS